jgi:hypothetical protein
MAVDSSRSYVTAFRVNDLSVSLSREVDPKTGYLAVFDSDFGSCGKNFACCDLCKTSLGLMQNISQKVNNRRCAPKRKAERTWRLKEILLNCPVGGRTLKVSLGVLFRPAKKQKHTTAGIRWWSPTQLLICRSEACVWQSGRDAQLSSVYGRM